MADKVASESWIEGIQAKAEWGLGSKTTDCDSRTEGVKMERLIIIKRSTDLWLAEEVPFCFFSVQLDGCFGPISHLDFFKG